MENFEQLTHCYECKAHGDDWMYDGEGEPVCACDDCFFNDDILED